MPRRATLRRQSKLSIQATKRRQDCSPSGGVTLRHKALKLGRQGLRRRGVGQDLGPCAASSSSAVRAAPPLESVSDQPVQRLAPLLQPADHTAPARHPVQRVRVPHRDPASVRCCRHDPRDRASARPPPSAARETLAPAPGAASRIRSSSAATAGLPRSGVPARKDAPAGRTRRRPAARRAGRRPSSAPAAPPAAGGTPSTIRRSLSQRSAARTSPSRSVAAISETAAAGVHLDGLRRVR